jgi:hypothetical protein
MQASCVFVYFTEREDLAKGKTQYSADCGSIQANFVAF